MKRAGRACCGGALVLLPLVAAGCAYGRAGWADRNTLPTITIAPGVTAAVRWGRGALVERLEMQANVTYPSQRLNEELFVTNAPNPYFINNFAALQTTNPTRYQRLASNPTFSLGHDSTSAPAASVRHADEPDLRESAARRVEGAFARGASECSVRL